MTTALRWGVLGTGGIARIFTSDLVENGFTVSAVGSRTQQSADAFARDFGISAAHASYEALAADPEVDVIYVSTPHPMHAANALLALAGGKHVLVEKAFTMNGAEARRVVEFAAERNLVVLEAMWTRWLPHMTRIRDIVARGTIGDVRTLYADHTQALSTDPAHRINAVALGGGALLDLGIYPISFAWDLFGAPTSVTAQSSPTATGVDRQTAVILGYDDGQQAVLHFALDTRGPNRATILGTRGRIEIDPVWYSTTSFTVYDHADEVVERFESAVSSRGMQFEAWELERRVTEGSGPDDVLPPRETVAIMDTLDEVRRQIGLAYPADADG